MPLPPEGVDYHVHHGDCIPHMAEMPSASVDFCVYSPPFPQIFSYTSLPEDLGNSEDMAGETRIHFSFLFRQLIRIMKPGRVMMVHCTQIPRMKRSGGAGAADFRGLLIRLAERAGFIYEYDWVVRRNPQAQAIRTKSRSLQFAGLESDRSRCRGAMPDILVKFVAPGENAVPVDSEGDVSRNQWIEWAECAWFNIKETETLNAAEAKTDSDVRHICPMMLPVIDRLVRLYSNPGEVVFSPFAGIGSEGYVALKHDRKFYGCEIKKEYFDAALKNLDRAMEARKSGQLMIWDRTGEKVDGPDSPAIAMPIRPSILDLEPIEIGDAIEAKGVAS